jgi:hypothetical protein
MYRSKYRHSSQNIPLQIEYLPSVQSIRLNSTKLLERVCINMTHVVRLKAAGQQTHRLRPILGLVSPEDGKKLVHSPIVRAFGSGPKDVQFYLDATKSYISIHQHFINT